MTKFSITACLLGLTITLAGCAPPPPGTKPPNTASDDPTIPPQGQFSNTAQGPLGYNKPNNSY